MLPQLIMNSLIAGCVYALVGVGFGLIYSSMRFFHLAHGIVFTAGPYLAFFLAERGGLPHPVALLLAVVLSALLGIAMEICVYRRLRRRTASPLVLLLASLGLYVVLQNVISVVFGDNVQTLRWWLTDEGISLAGARITLIQITTVCATAALAFALSVFLKITQMGRAIRAVADDPELAEVSGIGSDGVVLCAFAIGSGLAGVAGVLFALDVDMTPTMGMNVLMLGVVAAIIGGIGSIPGTVLGAILLGLAQNLGVWHLSTQWQDAIAFVVLLAFLLLKPQGLLGKKLKKAVV